MTSSLNQSLCDDILSDKVLFVEMWLVEIMIVVALLDRG